MMITKSKAKIKLDKALSDYVRKSNADEFGRANCFTCTARKNWKLMDCGHFITRAKMSTRWLYKPSEGLVNVACQCKRCNGFLGGQQYVFAKRLDTIYGEGTADKILRMSNETVKFSIADLEEMTAHYNDLFRKLPG
jgi:hypothetical protein